jgi:hypothetical protein
LLGLTLFEAESFWAAVKELCEQLAIFGTLKDLNTCWHATTFGRFFFGTNAAFYWKIPLRARMFEYSKSAAVS